MNWMFNGVSYPLLPDNEEHHTDDGRWSTNKTPIVTPLIPPVDKPPSVIKC